MIPHHSLHLQPLVLKRPNGLLAVGRDNVTTGSRRNRMGEEDASCGLVFEVRNANSSSGLIVNNHLHSWAKRSVVLHSRIQNLLLVLMVRQKSVVTSRGRPERDHVLSVGLVISVTADNYFPTGRY
jgi:hypothetical protein